VKHKWPLTPLGEVLTERHETPSEEDLVSGRVRIIEKISFDTGRIQFRSNGSTRTGMILVRPGDLVVSGINAAKGAIAIHDPDATEPIAATIHYAAYIPNPARVDVRFLWWMLRSHFFRELLNEYLPGGIKTELKAKRLLPVPVPMPSVEEQRRIVARIEELAAQIEEARRLRREAVEEAEALLMSALIHIPLPCETAVKPISACASMRTGTTPPRERDEYFGGPIKWYTPGDLSHRKNLGASSRTLSDLAVLDGKVKLFEPGTVLLVAIGASLGKVALVHERCAANQQITGITFSGEVIPEYGYWWMRRIGRDLLAASAKATLPIINQEGIGGFEICIPPLPVQRRIVAELDALQAEVDRLKALQAETAAEIDALMPAILDQAFKGEL
jgi:type I restriction enzyme S subunit